MITVISAFVTFKLLKMYFNVYKVQCYRAVVLLTFKYCTTWETIPKCERSVYYTPSKLTALYNHTINVLSFI